VAASAANRADSDRLSAQNGVMRRRPCSQIAGSLAFASDFLATIRIVEGESNFGAMECHGSPFSRGVCQAN
jgi:hypothetical protein